MNGPVKSACDELLESMRHWPTDALEYLEAELGKMIAERDEGYLRACIKPKDTDYSRDVGLPVDWHVGEGPPGWDKV